MQDERDEEKSDRLSHGNAHEEESAGYNEEQARNKKRTTASEQAAQNHFETGDWQDDAEQTINDKKRMNDLLDKEQEFTNKTGLKRIRKQLILLWSYVKAIMSGDYVDYSAWAFIKATAGLLYVVCPFDLIPDFFPWVGWADDILVIGYVCNLLMNELDAFAAWQKRRVATEG